MSPEETSNRKETTKLLTSAAMSFIRNKYYNRSTAMFAEVEVASNLRVDIICFTYADEVTIFEVKSCREDFKADKKWQKYLGYCNYFYFITVEGAILPEDLPPGVGLVYFKFDEKNKKNYNLVRPAYKQKGLNIVGKWLRKMYKKLAFRVASEDGLLND